MRISTLECPLCGCLLQAPTDAVVNGRWAGPNHEGFQPHYDYCHPGRTAPAIRLPDAQ